MEDELKIECENILLESIHRYGFSVCPQNYYILKKYSLLNIYYNILDNNMSGIPVTHLNEALKTQALAQKKKDCNFCELQRFLIENGEIKTKEILYNNSTYYKILINVLNGK